jgi:ABC-type transport system involved in multi-copper enzyme maturation permease subunit
MSFLPIVERELRVAARLTATYRNRALAAGVVAGVAMLILFYGVAVSTPSRMGAIMFRVLSYLTLGFCLLEGARKTADCVSEEKREGTLGLLFLTDLKGYDVILGKLAANSLGSIYGLLAILPVLGLPLLLGGVTPGEYWRVALALVNILFFSLCAGMFISSLSRGELPAVGGAALLVATFAAFAFLNLPHGLLAFSPVHAFQTAFDQRYAAGSPSYWASLVLAQLWSWLLLAAACLIVPHSWREKGERATIPSAWQARSAARRARMRTQMLDLNPIYWLAGRDRGRRKALYGFAGITLVAAVLVVFSGLNVLFGLMICAWVLNLAVKMWMAASAARCLAEARRTQSLEMILATPLTMDQIITGQIQALERNFRMPVFCILAVEFVALAITAVAYERGGHGNASVVIIGVLGYFLVFSLDIIAVAWTGMWFGLTTKKESQAAIKTILVVLVAPSVAVVCWCPGLVLYLAWPIFWIHWAQRKVHEEFARLAARRYALNPVMTGWFQEPEGPSGVAPPPLPGRRRDGNRR